MANALGLGMGLAYSTGRTASAVVAPTVSGAGAISVSGDSWTEGNEAKQSRLGTGNFTQTDRWDNQLATLLGGTNYTTPGQTGVTNGVINVGYGGQSSQTILTNVTNITIADSARLNDTWTFWGGRNNVGSDAEVSNVVTAATSFLALFSHQRKFLLPPSMSGSLSANIADWVREGRVRNSYWRNFRRNTFNHKRYWWGMSPNGTDGGATDKVDVGRQALITSLRLSAAVDQNHPNYVSSPYIAAAMRPLVEACKNARVYVLEQTIPDVPFNMAVGGTLEVYFRGYVTSCAITTDDPTLPGCFTIAMKAGSNDTAVLTRTSVSANNISRILNLTITASGVDTVGAAKTHTNNVRILPSVIGAGTNLPVGATFGRDADNVNAWWPRTFPAVSPFANNAKFTLVMCLKPTEDGVNHNLWVTESGRLIINRTSGNKIAIVLVDTNGVQIVNWVTVTTDFTIAGAATWLAISADLTSGSTAVKAWSGRSGSDVDIANGLAAPATGTSFLQNTASTPGMFAPSIASPSTFKGGVLSVWARAGAYFDFSVAGNRRLFWNTDGTPVDLGADGSTGTGGVPEVYFRGHTGDWLMGKNFGSGVDWGAYDNWLSGQTSADPTPF